LQHKKIGKKNIAYNTNDWNFFFKNKNDVEFNIFLFIGGYGMPWVGPLCKDLALIWVYKNHLFR
jgi:hypothetical protein